MKWIRVKGLMRRKIEREYVSARDIYYLLVPFLCLPNIIERIQELDRPSKGIIWQRPRRHGEKTQPFDKHLLSPTQ